MIPTNEFQILIDQAMREQSRSHMRPVIEKELLHYDILFALDKEGLLDELTFQGGTSLRLCYGAVRFSEDLDFAGGYDFDTKQFMSIKTCLETYLTKRYGLEVSVKEPKDPSHERNVNVSKWEIRIVTHPEQKNIPKQMIKIEIANIPAYTKEPKQLLHNYTFLPDGYQDTIIMVETLDELLADKVVSFVVCDHIRNRDIWDIYWLKQQGAKINMDLVNKKIQDYKIHDYVNKLDARLEKLPEIINDNGERGFKAEMKRFLPIDIQERTILNKNYLLVLSQEIYNTFDTLGFEWKEKKGELYLTNSLRKLTLDTFDKARLLARKSVSATFGKKLQNLIVSPHEEKMAQSICEAPIDKSSKPQGYEVDPLLKAGQWFLRFTDL